MVAQEKSGLNELKKTVFYELLNLAGRVFIVVRYSESVSVGNRGFLPEEKENGLVLVLTSRMHFTWDDYGIEATLVFGTSPQKCFIPAEDIIAVYSPELETQFVIARRRQESSFSSDTDKALGKELRGGDESKIVKIDFTKKKNS
jgi:hypothetical protein